jgi:hypothetical protein
MDSKGKEAPKQYQKEQYTIEELLSMYKKGYQLVSYGETRQVEVPGAGVLTVRSYPSGTQYCVYPNGKQERINDDWIKKLERLKKNE